MKRKRTRRDPDSGIPGGGAGGKEEVRGSGVHPVSGRAAPEDAVIRTPGEWGKGAGGEEGGRSELHFTEEELKRARESGKPRDENREES
jgi:hypothetical protein